MKVKLICSVWADTNECPDGLTIGNIYEVVDCFHSNISDRYYTIIDDNSHEMSWNCQCFEIIQQDIKVPEIYMFYKNKKCYATLGVTKPVGEDEYIKLYNKSTEDEIEFEETTTNKIIKGIKYDNVIYIKETQCDKELIVYDSLFENHIFYGMSLEFFSKRLTKKEENKFNQTFRFELKKED